MLMIQERAKSNFPLQSYYQTTQEYNKHGRHMLCRYVSEKYEEKTYIYIFSNFHFFQYSFTFIYLFNVYVCVITRQPLGAGSFHPPSRFWRLNSKSSCSAANTFISWAILPVLISFLIQTNMYWIDRWNYFKWQYLIIKYFTKLTKIWLTKEPEYNSLQWH